MTLEIGPLNNRVRLGERTLIMGILNVTPDSFSDGGRFISNEQIDARAAAMVAAGADIVDVGGESSRPFCEPVSAEEELNRVIPAIEAVRRRHSVPISVDTTKAIVARRAIEAGADIINDVSGMRSDPGMVKLVRDTGTPIVIMHMLGTPKTMQENPAYDDLMAEITAFLKERIDWAEAHGVSRARIIIDPGIGFGKTVTHNLTILKHIEELKLLGCPVLIGHSRKAFIGKILDREVGDRDVATACLSGLIARRGASIVRVHDVEKTVQAVRIAEAVLNAP